MGKKVKDYDHNAGGLEQSVGLNVQKTQLKVMAAVDEANKNGGSSPSVVVQILEKHLTHRELALMFMLNTMNGEVASRKKVIPMSPKGDA